MVVEIDYGGSAKLPRNVTTDKNITVDSADCNIAIRAKLNRNIIAELIMPLLVHKFVPML